MWSIKRLSESASFVLESHGTRQWFTEGPLKALSSDLSDISVFTSGTIYGEVLYDKNKTIIKCRFTEIRKGEERNLLEPYLRNVTDHPIEKITFEQMNGILSSCGNISTKPAPFLNLNINPTFPGTLWCGPGDRATTYEQLGRDVEADRCCRNHDLCPMLALPGTKKVKNGLNKYTISHCECDKTLQECLKNSDEGKAKVISLLFDITISECLASNGTIVNEGKTFDQLVNSFLWG